MRTLKLILSGWQSLAFYVGWYSCPALRKENTGETIVTIIIIIKYVYEKYIQNDVTGHYGIIYVMWRRR